MAEGQPAQDQARPWENPAARRPAPPSRPRGRAPPPRGVAKRAEAAPGAWGHQHHNIRPHSGRRRPPGRAAGRTRRAA